MNRAGGKDTLITYERALEAQAEVRKFRNSTIERKQMSTKTTFKRIALVAVAALSLSVVAVAPSQAAAAQDNLWVKVADGVTNGLATDADNNVGGGIAGTYNTVTLGFDAHAIGDVVEVTGSTIVSSDVASLNTAKTAATATSASAGVIVIATPTAGTITAKLYKNTGGIVSTTADKTVTITVGTTALSGVYSAAKSSVYLVSGETWTATADATTAPTAAKTYTSAESSTASIVVKYLDGLGKAVTGDSITATITSGPGTILTGVTNGKFDSTTALANLDSADSIGKYTASADADSQGLVAFYLFRNGQAGTSVVTIKNAAGTVIGSKSVIFTDTTVATMTVTVLKPTVNGDSTTRTSNVFELTVKDSGGNPIPGSVTITTTSGAATIASATQVPSAGVEDTATASSSGKMYWGLTPAAAAVSGPVTITFKAGLVTATGTVTLSSAKASTFTIASAPATAGGDVVHTITAKDAAGYAVPEGTVLSNYVSARTTTGGIATDLDITTANKSVGGVWTVKGTAPLATVELSTTYTLTGTAATADSNFVATLAGTKPVVVTQVNNPATDGAIDAANEATDAANAATDAALAAADAADAATAAAEDASAAVATLAKSVNTALANLKKQITALTALVNKLLKK